MSIRPRSRRAARNVAPEALEQRTLLTTIGSTLTEILIAQTNDSGVIQDLVDSGDIGENNGASLQARYDSFLEAAALGQTGRLDSRLESLTNQVELFVERGRFSQEIADEIFSQISFDGDHSDYDILREAVVATGNDDLLDRANGAFTVFAPTDRAFLNLAENLGGDNSTEAAAFDSIVAVATELGDGDPLPILNAIVQQHIVRGQRDQQWLQRTDYEVGDTVEFEDQRFIVTTEHRSTQTFAAENFDELSGRSTAPQQSLAFSQVVRADEIETFNNGTIAPDGRFLPDVDTDLPDARINRSRSDIPAMNGVIHTINQVMIPIDIIVPPTIAETLESNAGAFDDTANDFDILFNAIQTVDNSDPNDQNLADVFNNADASVTLFIPTDNGFRRLATELGVETPADPNDLRSADEIAFDGIVEILTELGDGDPIPLLRDLLTYHVLPGDFTVVQIVNSGPIETLFGDTITADGRNLQDQDPGLIDPRIVISRSNVAAENGKVHVIDRVLIPFDLPVDDTFADILGDGEFDSDSSDFDILARAIDEAGLTDVLDDPDEALTVFAPTDNAFITLAQELGFTGIDEAGAFDSILDTLTELGDGDPAPLLNDILLYHVAEGQRSLNAIQNAGSVTTLNGESFSVGNRLIDNDPDIMDGTLNENRSDVELENGILHVISRVLLPLDI